ncbi:hypothetical protein AB0J57_34205 [Streptomyces sp. NPDC049837]|uniref:hypothetical protein n=1 Tax=Streptomyces sp. NPDC049837 TaxID=3155277 RepID=UPI00342254DC
MRTHNGANGTLRRAVAAAMTVAALTGGVLASAPPAVAAPPTVDCTATPAQCPELATGFSGYPHEMALDGHGRGYVPTSAGNLYEVDVNTGRLTVRATGLGYATGVALDGQGRAYVLNLGGVLHEVNLANGATRQVTAGLGAGWKVALDHRGHAYTTDHTGSLWRVSLTDGGKTKAVGGLRSPVGVALDGRGHAYVSTSEGVLYEVDLNDGWSRRVVADWLNDAPGVAMTGSGTVAVATRQGHLYEVDPRTGTVREAARGLGDGFGVAVDAEGNAYVVRAVQFAVWKVPGAIQPAPARGLEVTAVPGTTAVPGGTAVPRVRVTNHGSSTIGTQDIRLTQGPAHVGWHFNVIYQDRQGRTIETPCTVDPVDRTSSLCKDVPLNLAPGESAELRTEVRVSPQARPCELPSITWHIADKQAKSDWLVLNPDGSRPHC